MEETCICSAVKYKDKIWFGHRHSDALNAMRNELSYFMNGKQISDIREDIIQGFITTKKRFVDRKEGYNLQISSGIKSVCKDFTYLNNELYSEDLY